MARDFDGASDITYTLNAGQSGISTVSVAWWEYLDANGQYARLWHCSPASGTQNWRMEFDDGWGYVWNVPWTSADFGRTAWSMAKPSTGSWHHVCITYDGSAAANDPVMYVNGVSQGITTRTAKNGTVVIATGTTLSFGSEGSTGNYLDGRVAEFGLWNRVLSAAEVASLGKGFAPTMLRRGLKLYLPLIGNDANEKDKIFATSGSVDAGVTKTAHPRIIYPQN